MMLKVFLYCWLLTQFLNTVWACTCFWGASDERMFCEAAFAIRGEVLEKIPQNPEIPEWVSNYPKFRLEWLIVYYQYKVKVEEVFKKPSSVDIPSTIVLETERNPGICSLSLPVGEELLLTGWIDGNRAWKTNACYWISTWMDVKPKSQEMLRKGIESVNCTQREPFTLTTVLSHRRRPSGRP